MHVFANPVTLWMHVCMCKCTMCVDVHHPCVHVHNYSCIMYEVTLVLLCFVERPVVTPQEHNVTLGTNITFDCNEFGSPPFTYQWYMRNVVTREDILLVNETDELYNLASSMYNDTGGYFCEASNSIGVLSNSTAAKLLGKNLRD